METLKYAGIIAILAACAMLLAKTISNNTQAQYHTSDQIEKVAQQIESLKQVIEAQHKTPAKD